MSVTFHTTVTKGPSGRTASLGSKFQRVEPVIAGDPHTLGQSTVGEAGRGVLCTLWQTGAEKV